MFNFKLPSLLNFWKKPEKPVQKRVIESHEEIARLLQRMREHIVIITARFPSDNDVYNTSIIDVDSNSKIFHLDEFLPAQGNHQIRKLKNVSLRARLDGAILTMDCNLKKSGEENNIPYFMMHFPDKIRSIQRRESYRVSIPASTHFQATLQTDAGNFIAGFLHDISFSGVSIRLEGIPDFELIPGNTIPFLTLHLDEVITCSMEIKRISHIIGHVVVAGRLEDLSPNQQKIIQRFILRLDREKRQKEMS